MTYPVWVTGARGFLGSHMARGLTADGVQAVGFGRAPGFRLPGLAGYYPHTIDGFAEALAAHGAPVRVFHLAGGATVGRSLAEPYGDFLSNVGTTAVLLEALRTASLHVPIIFASSAAVYGEGHKGGIDTDIAPTPSSPYGFHKIMAEQLLRSHAQSFGLAVTVLRLFSIYGPGLQKQLLFDLCTRLGNTSVTKVLTLGGTGAERRDWLHVDDTVAAMIGVEDISLGEVRIHNLASGQGTEIRTIADGLVSAWGEGRSACFSGVSRPGDPFSLIAAPSSLPPGFKQQVGLDAGLSGFVRWFRETNSGSGRSE